MHASFEMANNFPSKQYGSKNKQKKTPAQNIKNIISVEKSAHNAQNDDLIPTAEHVSAELIIWLRFLTSNLIPGRSQTWTP